MQDCPQGTSAFIFEKDGEYHPSCMSTGIFYAPPFSIGALAEMLFPGAWDTVPPG